MKSERETNRRLKRKPLKNGDRIKHAPAGTSGASASHQRYTDKLSLESQQKNTSRLEAVSLTEKDRMRSEWAAADKAAQRNGSLEPEPSIGQAQESPFSTPTRPEQKPGSEDENHRQNGRTKQKRSDQKDKILGAGSRKRQSLFPPAVYKNSRRWQPEEAVLTEDQRALIKTYSQLMEHYVDVLESSPSACRTWEQMRDKGWQFQFDDLGNGGYLIDKETRTLWIDQSGLDARSLVSSDYFYASAMMNVLRALRDGWQEARWSNSLRTYHPESLLRLEKMRAADSDVVAILFAKELQAKGHYIFLRHLLASEDAFLGRYFIHDDYQIKVQTASAFRCWFLNSKKVDTTDHETLCFLDEVLSESGFGNPFGRNRLTPIEVVRMGCLPDGTSYLAGYGEAVLRDPVFAGLTDPVNQAHYFHLIRDMESFLVNGVPFRSPQLAAKIFPEGETVIQE